MKYVVAALTAVMLLANPANAEIKIGVNVSMTGPVASLGIPQANTVALMPGEAGGEKIRYILLDDATDPTKASQNARKLILDEKVDVIIGGTTVITSIAVNNVASENKTPQIAFAPMDVTGEKFRWTFRTVQPNSIVASTIAKGIKQKGYKRIAVIGQDDTFGDQFTAEVKRFAPDYGYEIVASERFARSDTSVSGQMLHIIAAKPDALVVAAGGTPAALPELTLAELGTRIPVFQSHAAGNADFVRVGGEAVEGSIAAVATMLVADQLADDQPSKPVTIAYRDKYNAKYGAGLANGYGAQAWDAADLIALAIPGALKIAKPGSPEFRAALRDELEKTTNHPGILGVYNMTPADHTGVDERSTFLARVQKGKWKLEH